MSAAPRLRYCHYCDTTAPVDAAVHADCRSRALYTAALARYRQRHLLPTGLGSKHCVEAKRALRRARLERTLEQVTAEAMT